MTVLKKEKSTVLARRLITGEVVALQQGACCCSLPAYELQYMRCVQVERHQLAVCFLSRTVAALSHSVSPSLSSPHITMRGARPLILFRSPSLPGCARCPFCPPEKFFRWAWSPPPPLPIFELESDGDSPENWSTVLQATLCLSSGRLD
jgi:hypothetical protein